jgi:hypothetical protein
MSDFPISPDDMRALRRAVHAFLLAYGAAYWIAQMNEGAAMPNLPPTLDQVPAAARPLALAYDEARRVAVAPMYCLDPGATALAVKVGATTRPAAQRAMAGPADPAEGNSPPSSFGFLRWANGVSYSSLGIPIIACHWGPIDDCYWVVFWSDNYALAEIGEKEHHLSRETSREYLEFSGPLFYEHSLLIPPVGVAEVTGGCELPVADGVVDEAALVYTLRGTWATLTVSGMATLTRHGPIKIDRAADLLNGMEPTSVTCAQAAAGNLAGQSTRPIT